VSGAVNPQLRRLLPVIAAEPGREPACQNTTPDPTGSHQAFSAMNGHGFAYGVSLACVRWGPRSRWSPLASGAVFRRAPKHYSVVGLPG